MADPVVLCACGGAHAWRAAKLDDPPELASSHYAAHAALTGATPAFAGTKRHTVERRLAHGSRWVAEPQEKDLIVLHYTEGGLPTHAEWGWAACNVTWSSRTPTVAPAMAYPGVGSTALGVDRAGRIVEFYPPQAWSHHASANTAVHKRSIGIELANLGWVFDVQDAKGKVTGRQPRCGGPLPSLDGFVPVSDLPAEVRAALPPHFVSVAAGLYGSTAKLISGWHGYPDAQLEALADLVDGLCTAHGIPREVLPLDSRHRPLWFPNGTGSGVARGIVCHSNFVHADPTGRSNPKWDTGPAFPWERFAKMIGATVGRASTSTVFSASTKPAAPTPAPTMSAVRAADARLVKETSDPDIRQLERQLNFLGYPCGRADGVVDAETRAGVRAFQERYKAEKKYAVDGSITRGLMEHVKLLYNAAGGAPAEAAREAAADKARLERLRRTLGGPVAT